jgi:DNA helicase-2/ATP-dependent DNA helicase PcrA
MGGEVSRFVEEIDPQYIEIPAQRRSMPEPGTLPHAFFNAGKPAPKTQCQQKAQPVQKPRTATIPNTPAQIGSIMPGMKVSHEKFGIGKVLGVEGSGDSRKATVFFEGVGQKQLMLKFAKLTIVE